MRLNVTRIYWMIFFFTLAVMLLMANEKDKSPNVIFSTGDNLVALWYPEFREKKVDLGHQFVGIDDLVLSPDGTTVAFVAMNMDESIPIPTIWTWNMETNNVTNVHVGDEWLIRVSYGPHGQLAGIWQTFDTVVTHQLVLLRDGDLLLVNTPANAYDDIGWQNDQPIIVPRQNEQRVITMSNYVAIQRGKTMAGETTWGFSQTGRETDQQYVVTVRDLLIIH